ncbi:MAG: hypothetical protein ACOCSN_05190 [Halanaeroarchaeum sp.]
MSHKRQLWNLAIVLGVVMVVVSAGAGAFAAPGDIDGSQSDSTEEVHLEDEKTVDDEFNASGDTSWNMTIENVPDDTPEDTEFGMNVTHDDVEYYEYTGEFDEYDDGGTDTVGKYHAFDDDELADVPMEIDENVTFTVNYWNESADAEDRDPENITVYVENTDERSVVSLNDDEVDDSSAFDSVEQKTGDKSEVLGMSIPTTGADYSQYALDNVDASEENDTEVVVVLANDTAASDYDDTFGELDSETWKVTSIHNVDGDGARAYADAPDTDAIDTDEDAYVVYESDVGGEEAIIYHNVDDGDDIEGSSTPVGYLAINDIWGAYGLDGIQSYYMAGGPIGAMLILFGSVGRRRTDEREE